ncbi:MAG: hypothetical protein V4671_12800 [Armatimonadota bacterium]
MQRRNFVNAFTVGLMGWIAAESKDAHPASAQAVTPVMPVTAPTLPSEIESLAVKQQHIDWICKMAVEIGAIKPGMTREDLRRLFREEGGFYFSTMRLHRTYIYRNCDLIKVDVHFQPVPDDRDSKGRPSSLERPEDIITKISYPFFNSVR